MGLYLSGEPVSARNGGSLYRLGRLVRRNAMASSALGLLFLSLIGGLIVSVMFAQKATQEADNARKSLVAAENPQREQNFEALTLIP